MKTLAPVLALAVSAAPALAAAEDPFYRPVGELVPGSGEGTADATVYAPGMRFPIENAPAYPNSQVWGHGGSSGPGGSQCDVENYSYPWHDNYCETRSWDMPLCPSGVGHQGQDMRPSTCEDGVHPYVAVADGTITNIGSYSVYLTAPDGTRFDYLHGNGIVVSEGDGLTTGQHIGNVSNEFGGTATTIHLHFNISQDVAGVGFVYVSPYMSLVAAYEELTGLGNTVPAGPVDAVDCTSIRGWAQDPDTPEQPVEVRVYFGGAIDDPNATGISVSADVPRDDLCEPLGSCAHGFDVEIPRSLRDDESHPVFVYAVDTEGEQTPLLEASPGEFACPPPAVPDGVKRAIAGPEAVAAWGFSTFWDLATVDAATLADIPDGSPLPDTPLVVRGDGDPEDALWLVDDGRKRSLSDPAVREAWAIDPAATQVWPQQSVDDIPEGKPLRADVFLVGAQDGVLYVMDDEACPPNEACGGGDDATDGGADETADDGGDDAADDGTDSGLTGGATGERMDDGCGCTSDPRRDTPWFFVLAIAVARQRRSRRASSTLSAGARAACA